MITPKQQQKLDKIRKDWKPGARLTTWGPKDAVESINLLLTLLDQAQRDTERVDWMEKQKVSNLISRRMALYFNQSILHDSLREAIDDQIKWDKQVWDKKALDQAALARGEGAK